MKITNEQLKQIIKEELQSVMNESEVLLGLGALAAIRKRRAAAAKRKADKGPLPRGGYKRGYGGPSSASSYKPDPEIERILQQRSEKEAAAEEKQRQERENVGPALEALGQAKLEAALKLGTTEDGGMPYMNAYGGGENWLGTYYDGPMDYFYALDMARRHGHISESAIDDESGGFHLDALFPGKYLPSQLPIFDKDDNNFYSDSNYQSLVSGGYMDDDYSYDFTDKGNKMRKLLGL